MKRYITLIGVLLAASLSVEAQILKEQETEKPDSLVVQTRSLMISENTNNNYIPQVIPPSPESQIFERYINHEIDECSGRPNISIPLYDIKIKGLTLPITLSYDASGVKYDQFNGNIGVGWSIPSMGYRAFREVHGRPDDKYPFYKQDEFDYAINHHDDSFSGYYFLSLISSLEYLKIVPWDKYQRQDSEYDIFSYLLPSSNGNFIITDRNQLSTAIIEQNRDKIVLNKGYTVPFENVIESMYITDENGFKYELGGKDFVGHWRAEGDYNVYNGWALKKIISPYGDTVEFEYDVIEAKFENRVVKTIGLQINNAGHYVAERFSFLPFSAEEIMPGLSGRTEFYLKKIKAPNTIVEFVYNEADLLTSYPSLKTIIIRNNQGQEIKRIGFNYSDFGYGKWHRLLESVEEGKGSEKLRKYDLSYYLPDIDDIETVTPDQWGYYSQNQNNIRTEFPLALHKEIGDYKVRTENKDTAKRSLSSLGYKNFFDRSKNYGLLHSFSLKRITFPTGGYTEYEYESHQYMANGVATIGGGQRIKRITSKTEESSTPILTEFKYGENEGSVGIANFPWLDESHFIRDSYFYEMKWISLSDLPGSISGAINVSYQEQRSYMMNPIMPEFSKFNISYKEISTYKHDINNSVSTKITSKYDIPEQYQYGGLNMLAEPKTERSVHTTHGSNEEVYDYSLGLKPNLRERIYYDNKLVPVRKEEYTYDNTRMEIYEGRKVRQNVFFHYDPNGSLGNVKSGSEYVVGADAGTAMNPFTYVKQLCNYTPYYVKAGVNNLLISKKITDYVDGKTIETEEKFSYDERLQLKSTSLFNSQTVEKKEEYKYPYNFGTDVYKTMLNKNIIAPIVEKNVSYNGKKTFTEKTQYANMEGLILPSSIETSSQGADNQRAEIVFTKYDKRGNIQEYMTPNGVYTVILWSYNYQYPVLKIENSRYKDIGEFYLDIIEDLASQIEPSDGTWDFILEYLDGLPATAHVTTYTYDPLVGLTSIEDPSGRRTYYEYDSFGRLARIKQGGKIIEEYNYQYAGN